MRRLASRDGTWCVSRARVCRGCQILDLLDLRHVADWLVGDTITGGISASQRKLLTVGIELVANPSMYVGVYAHDDN